MGSYDNDLTDDQVAYLHEQASARREVWRNCPMSIEARLNLKTTPEMRERIRELTKRDGIDDYDRAVMLLLDDFASCMVMLGILAGGESRRGDAKN